MVLITLCKFIYCSWLFLLALCLLSFVCRCTRTGYNPIQTIWKFDVNNKQLSIVNFSNGGGIYVDFHYIVIVFHERFSFLYCWYSYWVCVLKFRSMSIVCKSIWEKSAFVFIRLVSDFGILRFNLKLMWCAEHFGKIDICIRYYRQFYLSVLLYEESLDHIRHGPCQFEYEMNKTLIQWIFNLLSIHWFQCSTHSFQRNCTSTLFEFRKFTEFLLLQQVCKP